MFDPNSDLPALLAALRRGGDPLAPPRWAGHPLRHRRRQRPVTYRVRLDLLRAKPPIWRRLDLASDLRLDQLHDVIQVAMGWDDFHLHAFGAGGHPFSPHGFEFLTAFGEAEGERGTPESSVRLDETIHEAGDRLWYTYDFGDGWDHQLRVEEVRPREPDDPAFVCVGGRRRCPPEDCGGIFGYQDILAFLDDPTGVPDWLAEHAANFLDEELFDPAEFDVRHTNQALAKIRS